MKWLEEVAKFHKDYVRIVRSMGEDFYAEDIVQEFYIKLSKYCKAEQVLRENGQVNKSYVYFILRNIFLDFQKQKNRFYKVPIDETNNIGVNYEYKSEGEGLTSLIKRVEEEAATWHWYDEMLFKYYFKSGKSMRELAEETRISTSSIFQTIKYCKAKIKENIKEDYEDYINEDYELL